MYNKKFTIVIDASRNRSGGSIEYLKNFIKYLKLDSSKIDKVILFSYKNLLKEIPHRSFLIKYSHPFLEKNILFQIIWQAFYLPFFLNKNKNNILFTTDSTSFCKFKPSIVFNQDILSFDKEVIKKMPFTLQKLRLYVIRAIQIKAMNNASKIIFLSNFFKKIVLKTLTKKKNYKIIPHGIENKLRTLGKKKLKKQSCDFNKKKIKLIYVSPLFHYKNQITVAKAYTKLKKKYNNLDIKFVGSFNQSLKIYNQIINNNPLITKKNFIGEVNHNKVINLLNESDIFIFASSCETFGITLLEAMALGMPIVCSNKSSLPEILGDGGIYFDPENETELYDQVNKLIKSKKLREKKSKISIKLSLKFTWENNVKHFNDSINSLLKK